MDRISDTFLIFLLLGMIHSPRSRLIISNVHHIHQPHPPLTAFFGGRLCVGVFLFCILW
eukprot:NODE_8182_length_296_cov_21.101215_g7442_i0.p2 GENE.NODE_8182_length_296_cov_21.101215_g7442_i0~~NODE_8182_length_296_cov_21.101215_g7442_i0.p2  ORF type:complete len:59 (+),score=5.33 NODE_8182_length_296_cov_21.101215_g7442_i0:87-263(+)